MKQEYRILENEDGFYAQARYKRLLFWSKWYRISQYMENHGDWLIDSLSYPFDTYDKAYELIQQYKKKRKNFTKITKVE